MRVAVFGTRDYDRTFLDAANAGQGGPHELTSLEPYLNASTATLAWSFPAVSVFVNDRVDQATLDALAGGGTRLIALRSAGFNNVDLQAASRCDIAVVRVPEYSPYAVAEHTVGLMLSLNRKINRAYNRVREGNFELDGLLGFDMHGRTVGIVGTGRIGRALAQIVDGFGCCVVAYDPVPNLDCQAIGVEFVSLDELYSRSDIVTLHCPLTPATHHLIDADAVGKMKPGVMLINTGRGGLVDTPAVIAGLKAGRIGYLGLDVYEEESALFFRDLSNRILTDDVFARLLTFPNVLVTGHQAFFTREALTEIARVTIDNIRNFEEGRPLTNAVTADRIAGGHHR
jgi:D-lactate dehydrogenase